MAIGTAQKSKSKDQRRSPDKVIDKQLSRVRRHIRLTDLISGFMTLAAGLLTFILLVVLIDHWLFGLGPAFRWLALFMLIVGPVWYFATRIAPAMIRGINPAFAAQTIERSEPTLKNSVLNYLLLRRDRAALHEVVYQAVQQQAAADVSQVAVEQTVDRSAVIQAGYVLVAVMVVAAAYKILSPKDPVQTVRRIVAPWADIVRPARVLIEDVQPGDADVFHGSKVTISARVRGANEKDQIKVLYSTEDGQLIDRELRMKLDPSGLRYVTDVSPESEGIEQSLAYRIVAGDTMTNDFHLHVVSAPTIQVDTVEYDFPLYTRRPREVVRQQGDLKAVEGTRVTIRARTNQPIQAATIHLQSTEVASGDNRTASLAAKRFPMDFRGTDTWRTIFLEMSDDRRTPKHSGYHLEFTNNLGQPSQRPVVHRIEVIPDLAPEIEILTPVKQRIEVPLSGSQPIEIRAIDPDYGLSQLRLKATVGGKELFSESLLAAEAAQQPGQVVTTFDFQPKQWKLAINDQVSYWAEAADNRTAVNSDSPAPNISRSRTFHMLIVADPPQQRPDPDAEKGSDNQAAAEKQPTNPAPQNSTKKGEPKAGNQKRPPTNPGESTKQESNPGDRQPQDPNAGGKPEPRTGETGKQNAKSQEKQQPGLQQNGEKGESGSPPSAGQEGNKTESGSSAKQGESQPMPGQGTGGQQTGGNTPQKSGDGAKEKSAGDKSDGPGQYREPQAGEKQTEPLHDGEVFERALNKLKGNRQPGSAESSGDNQSGDQASEGNKTEPGKEEGQKKGPSDSAQSESSKGSAETEKSAAEKGQKASSEPAKANDANKKPSEQGKAREKSGDKSQSGNEKSDQHGQEKGVDEKSKTGSAAETQPENAKGKQTQPNGEPDSGEPKHADKSQGEGDLRKGAPGEGGKSARGGQERPEKGSQKKEPSQDGGKDPGNSDNGQSGAGKNSKDKTGSGSVEKAKDEDVQNSDRKKKAGSEDQAPQEPGENGASTSKKQSDSQGGESGDRSGGGKKGSGQGAKQPGNDSAGSQSSSDDGAGKSEESGKGETADKRGGDKSAKTPTGQSGDKQGAGSGAVSSPDGTQSGEGANSKGQKAQPGQPKPPQTGSKGGAAGSGQSAPPTGGGVPNDNQGGTPAPDAEVPDGDAANLDYANRATDLVLDYLRDQQDEPDRKLLEELGWTADDLKAFLNRWQALKDKAVEDPKAKRELDESLRSLGIQPARDTKRKGNERTDDARGLRESGIDSKPPAMYQEQFRAFKKGAARGK